ncbi:MAG: hypothetical protein ABI890_13940, partial [Lapillicoccus sp.]
MHRRTRLTTSLIAAAAALTSMLGSPPSAGASATAPQAGETYTVSAGGRTTGTVLFHLGASGPAPQARFYSSRTGQLLVGCRDGEGNGRWKLGTNLPGAIIATVRMTAWNFCSGVRGLKYDVSAVSPWRINLTGATDSPGSVFHGTPANVGDVIVDFSRRDAGCSFQLSGRYRITVETVAGRQAQIRARSHGEGTLTASAVVG